MPKLNPGKRTGHAQGRRSHCCAATALPPFCLSSVLKAARLALLYSRSVSASVSVCVTPAHNTHTAASPLLPHYVAIASPTSPMSTAVRHHILENA